jgi:hypothetical protein|tara:strand:- start:121 stop:351 length:231 start_codon:yes stop_codon:yes gene_type:complete
MAIFNLEISDNDVDRVFDAICSNYKWTEESGETKGDFTHKVVRQFLADNVRAYEIAKAKAEATASIDTSVGLSDPS